jgi:histone-lysine N-methyltransferase SETD2
MEDDSMQIEPASSVPSSSQIFLDVVENCNSEITSEAPRSECGKDLNHVDASDSASSEREDFSQGLTVKEKDSATDQLYNSSAGNTPRGDDEAFDTQSVLISPKPVKVKSRWRRTSELEQVVGRNGNSDQSSCNNSPLSMSPKTGCSLPVPSDNRENQLEEKSRMALSENVAIIQERLKSFEIVEENQYLTSRKTSKEVKRMLCDCSLTKEEIARGELGCGEDCINRLLMIEW